MTTVHSLSDERERICERIRKMTGWQTMKCLIWMNAKNPLLGMVSPTDMIAMGRIDRLERFIGEAEEMNAYTPETPQGKLDL